MQNFISMVFDSHRFRLVFLGPTIAFLGIVLGLNTVLAVEQDLAVNNKAQTIIVGVELDYPPFAFIDPEGEVAGFSSELAQTVGKVMGLDLRLQIRPWTQIREALEAGRIDVIAGMAYSEERDKLVDFSPPFFAMQQAIFAHSDSPEIKSESDLRNRKIIVVKGDILHDYVLENGLFKELELADTLADAVRLLATGRYDYAILAQLPGLYWVHTLKLSNISTVGSPVITTKYCFAFKEGDSELVAKFSEGISILEKTGRYREIYEKWLGVLEPPGISLGVILKYSLLVLIPMLVLLLLSFLWSKSLQKKVSQRTHALENEISERRRTEEALRGSEAQMRTLVNTIPDLVWLKDPEGVYLACNRKFERLFGAAESEIIGKTDYDFVDEKVAEGFKKTDRAVMDSGRLLMYEEEARFAGDGHLERLETLKTPMCNFENKLIGVLGVARDITQRKKAEEEKLKLKTQLEQSQKMESIGTLAGGIAHDFNNILSGIFGYSHLAKTHIKDAEKAGEYIDQLVKGAQKAAELVQQILMFSRKSKSEKYPLKISMVIKEALKLLRSSIPSTITIKENIVSEASVLADPTQIHQIMMNLCTNAYHAMRETGGTLGVGLGEMELSANRLPVLGMPPGHYLKLEVSDDGYGMDSKILDRIFEPYFTTKDRGEGTGLGLSVVIGIIKEHNGFIKVYSEPGYGTTFHIYLPVIDADPVSQVLEKKEAVLPGGTEKIMLVDDEEIILRVAHEILKQFGYRVSPFNDGAAALEVFEKDPNGFDLVITDMTMPVMTGLELSKKILGLNPLQPIILCTGHSELINREKAVAMGISEYFEKPIVVEKITKVIRTVIDKQKKNH